MPNYARGGRGRQAPYETEMYRIPSPIKPVVEQLGHMYRSSVGRAFDPDGAELLAQVQEVLDSYPQSQQSQIEKAIALLKEALSMKANAGGAIKKQIREALTLLGDSVDEDV